MVLCARATLNVCLSRVPCSTIPSAGARHPSANLVVALGSVQHLLCAQKTTSVIRPHLRLHQQHRAYMSFWRYIGQNKSVDPSTSLLYKYIVNSHAAPLCDTGGHMHLDGTLNPKPHLQATRHSHPKPVRARTDIVTWQCSFGWLCCQHCRTRHN